MKVLLTAILALFALYSQAQTGFPVTVSSPISVTYSSPVQISKTPNLTLSRLNESPLFATAKNSGTNSLPRPISSATLNVSTTIEPGKKFALKGVQVMADRPVWVGLTVRKSEGLAFNNAQETTFFTVGEKDFDKLIPYDEMLFEGAVVSVAASPQSSTANEAAYLTLRLVGQASTLMELDNPDYRICVIGDSKPLSSIDPGAYGERYYVNQLANYLLGQGKRVSIIDKTLPSSSSSDMVKFIKSGAIDAVEYDLLIVATGTNNANSSASTGNINQFKADLLEPINHRNRRRPNASVLFMTPGVTDKIALVLNIAGYRTAMTDVATDPAVGTASHKVYLCQEHTAFTISASVKSDRFIATEALTNQVHYSMLGHDDVYNTVFLPAVKTTDFYTNILKLTN
jgi:hypothetical protein